MKDIKYYNKRNIEKDGKGFLIYNEQTMGSDSNIKVLDYKDYLLEN